MNMNTIPDLIKEEKYLDLLNTCEQLEIQSAIDASIDLCKIYPIYLASCILTNELQTSRHVRKRILKNTELNTAEVQAIWQTITSILKKAYPQVYHNLDTFQWSEYMQPLIVKIRQQIREQMFQLISNIYTSIELSQATSYFGLPESDILQELLNRGWKYDEANKILYPVKNICGASTVSKQHQFEKLSDIVLNLEKF